MYTYLTFDFSAVQAIRDRAQTYPRQWAEAMVREIQTQFGSASPAPSGSPPARKSGALARSIVAVRVDNYRWRVIAGASYAPYLEFGTKRMMARPFFLRGFMRVKR